MAQKHNQKSLHFDINPAVVFRLGEELITDEVQALVELVKNSYDADASWVKITIDTGTGNNSGKKHPDAKGMIRVEDNGFGMSIQTIEQGWLTIAGSPKKESKKRGEVTERGRTPIGDKGLGRLGVQRLARNVEIVTRPKDEKSEFRVAFSWGDFREARSLWKVPVSFEETKRDKSDKPGTVLILSDLTDVTLWCEESRVRDLQKKLSGMISPFEEARDFVVHVEIDGKHIELAEIAQRVRETALLKYEIKFDGTVLHISGKARFEYLAPTDKESRAILISSYRRDDGKTIFDFLSQKGGKRRPQIFNRSKLKGWFAEFGTNRLLEDVDGVKLVGGAIANPGSFRGEIDAVALDRTDFEGTAFDRQSDYRRLVADLAGVHVYRDGFGIRVGGDWLGLGKQWTTGTSYYGLRPSNVLGFIALTAKGNSALVETTSREGFQVNPHYENFYSLLAEFVRFSGEVQEFLRRGVLDFANSKKEQKANVEPEDTAADITRRIDDFAENLFVEKDKIQKRSGKVRQVAQHASSTLAFVRNELKAISAKDKVVKTALGKLENAVEEVATVADDVEKVLAEASGTPEKASELKAYRAVLDQRWDSLHDEVSALYESVSLGLTAEVLSHEINNIADRLAKKSSSLLKQIRGGDFQKSAVITFVEHVRTSVAAMRRQLSHLTPSLRFLREKREQIDMARLASEITEFYHSKLKDGINILVNTKTIRSFSVHMNKGKLTQIFDNMVLNAEYWLKEDLRKGKIDHGEISIIIDSPVVRVLDNGIGVDPSVEEMLFEPFITKKRKSEGRGLGLFIVQQLLDSESCSVLLTPERNSHDRRHVFEIDFSGAING